MSELNEYLSKSRNIELIRRGLYRIRESNTNPKTEFSCYDSSRGRYIEVIPMSVSDEEYQKILETNYIRKADSYKLVVHHFGYKHVKSSLPRVFYIVSGVTFAVAFLLSIYLLERDVLYTIGVLFGGFLVAVLFYGVGKMVELLEEIKYRL